MEIQLLNRDTTNELEELISVFEDVFEMENFKEPGKTHLQKLLNQNTFFAVVAKKENRIIGGLTVYIIDQYYSEKPLAYIYDLAVVTEYQRQGIGRRLMEFTNEYCRQNGFDETFVQAEIVDDHAVDFYRLTKPTREQQTIHFSYKL